MRLTARFPESTPAQPMLEGVVEVTGPVRGVGAPAADAFLVEAGRVVTTPIAQDAIGVWWDLAEGETRTVPAFASLMSCETNHPLAPGAYELYVVVTVVPDDGPPRESFGGPWPLLIVSR